MINNVEFQPVKNSFLSKLKEDIKTIKETKELPINTDKSSNIYKMEKDTYTYKKCLRENVTKTHKRSNRNKVYKISIEENKIATKLKIDDRVQQFHEAEVFITVKEHKDSFINFRTFRLSDLLDQRLIKSVSRFLTRSIMR